MLTFFVLIVAAFAVYSINTTKHYRKLRTDEVSKTVAFESERVGRVIAEMERNAVDLALSGRQFYLSKQRSDEMGISIVTENFSSFTSAVGGGIWYEPFVLDADVKRKCYYAFFDAATNSVNYDPDFESEEYNYHAQQWYTTIAEGVENEYDAVWTVPYTDDAGTNALMTTVGAGIFDDEGRFVGMSTVDWEIQSMVDRLSDIKPTENSFVLLASPKDDYIISVTQEPVTNASGKSLRDIHWYGEINSIGSDGVDISHFDDGGIEYVAFSRTFGNGWLFSVQIPTREIFVEIEARNNRFTIIIAVSFLTLLSASAYLLNKLLVRPLHKLTNGVAELGNGDLDKQIEIYSKDELGTLAAAFNKMTVDLKESINQNARERAEKERIGAELNIATQIQASMLPCIFPPFPDRSEFDIYAKMIPAKEVGGDFYDFFLIDENTLAVVMADVSGKGVPAALFMVIAKTLIKNNAQYDKSPKEVFEVVNNLLCENNETGMFVTAFLGYLDIPSGKFTFVNAGHNPPLIYKGGGFEWLKTKPGFVLAGMEDVCYQQNEIIFKPNQGLFLYTDGITESENSEGRMFGEARLMEAVNNYYGLPLREFNVAIKNEIDKFADGAQQADDITMLALQYKGLNLLREQTHEITVEARLGNIEEVSNFISECIEKSPLATRNQIMIATDEIFSNIARYAYTDSVGNVSVRVSVNAPAITVEFEDSGIAFNPLLMEDPNVEQPIEERKIGGLGIFMVKNIMDSVEYQRKGDKNILTIKKYD